MHTRKSIITDYFNEAALTRDAWKARNSYYYSRLEKIIAAHVEKNRSVLELGCGTGDLLAAARPSRGVGIDISTKMVEAAQRKYPKFTFLAQDAESLDLSEKFDYIIISDLIGHLSDIWGSLKNLHSVCHKDTKVIITYYNFVWEPVLRLAEKLNLKMRQGYQNWLGRQDIRNFLYLTDFSVEKEGVDILLPKRVPLFSRVCNDYLSQTMLFRWASLLQYFVAMPYSSQAEQSLACSVIVPTRNERNNIDDCVSRIPAMGAHTEIIFVDGASTDGTQEKIEEAIIRQKGKKDIKLVNQVPSEQEKRINAIDGNRVTMLKLGKGDAVRKGFDKASGDILMILDADLTVPPEDLPKFYHALASKKADFVNGSRLVYPLEDEAMPVVNYFGNKFFSLLFTWLLEQPIKDTLCGTKALRKKDYEAIKNGRSYFGDFDPFGDFDLLFGAARQKMKIIEMPIAYKRRRFGYTKVQVYKHGLLLLKMSFIAFMKLKLRKWLFIFIRKN